MEPAQTLLLIRHAEKPNAGVQGVDVSGVVDGESLTPRGWQRAGAWTQLFAPPFDLPGGLPKLTKIFASAPATHHELALGAGGSKSKRPLETVSALADRLGLMVDLSFSKGEEGPLAKMLGETPGVTLVCWQHENIAAIASGLEPTPTRAPNSWPGDRFNLMFRFQRQSFGTGAWAFDQLAPILLKDDSAATL